MKTSHVVTVHIELARPTTPELVALPNSFTLDGLTYNERPLEARVSLVTGTRDELEVEWINESQLDGMTDAEIKVASHRGESLWWDGMKDEPSELDDAIDHQLALYKERREDRMFGR